MLKRTHLFGLALASAPLFWLAGGCGHYDPPPGVSVAGLSAGTLGDPRAPLVIDFGKAIDPATLRVKVAFLETDPEGNLPDEDDNPDTELRLIARKDNSEGDLGAQFDLEADGSRLRITTPAALPVGPKLVLLVEGGLRALDGTELRVRTRVPFAYAITCGGTKATTFASGVYFVLLEVEQPLGTQIQLYGAIDVDPATGSFAGQFTNADRNRDGTRCPSACPATDACRLLPSPECVAPSARAGTADEYTDFVPNVSPPTGYSFVVRGCAVDDGEAVGIVTAPATMIVEQPKVTVQGLTMTARFVKGADGVTRATGSLIADATLLGTAALGPGKGSMTAVRMPDDKVPAGVPQPPKATDAGAPAEDAAK
ncbi:MAG: hypothetical protein JWM74_2767 [Myxococcaceae bacterium]|nr:hypothetical protein [Myxococcaceae bacterium]